MQYRVKMTPLEPYTFGTDIGFQRPEGGEGKTSYFMQSNTTPDPTTILGMLRFLVLEQTGLLKTNFQYSEQEQEIMAKSIGKDSYSYSEEKEQSFGEIQNISPVFIMNNEHEYIVSNPFHNTSEDEFQAMKMEKQSQYCQGNEIVLPCLGEFDAKKGHADGYYNITRKHKIVDDVFQSIITTGNRKNGGNETGEDGFFKREMIGMKEGYSFAVFVEMGEVELPQNTMAYMGYRKSSFLIETEKVEKDDLVQQVQNAFPSEDIWYYALSNVVLANTYKSNTFAIVEEKQVRNLETKKEGDGKRIKIRKSECQYNLIKSGSVFHKSQNIEMTVNGKQIGYNYIIPIGGR